MKNIKPFLAVLSFLSPIVHAQNADYEGEGKSKINLCSNIEWKAEMQGSFSKGKTPLWLNANKHGLSSLDDCNGYLRGSLVRPLESDSARRWAVGYGLDIAVPVNYTSSFIVQQAFAEVRWLHGTMTIGSKEYPMELKNQTLSSGSQTLGINARPIPQVRLALPEYITLPILNGWLQLKGHIAYGMMTDDRWQHEFTSRQSKYADHVLFHSKAGYLKIENQRKNSPWSVELGLEMGAEFGGNPYQMYDGQMVQMPTEKGLKGFWHAFVPGGSDATDGEYTNAAGNQMGSWLMRVNYQADSWALHAYLDHFLRIIARCSCWTITDMVKVMNGIRRRSPVSSVMH